MRRRRLQVATEETDPDDLEAEKGGASWRNLVGQGQGLKFEKTVEERRAELRRDDDYKTFDPLAKDGRAGVDMRKSQHRRRLDEGVAEREGSGRRDRAAKW